MLKKRVKQCLAGILSAAMLVTGIPVSAFAAPSGLSQEQAVVIETGQENASEQVNQEDLPLAQADGAALMIYGSAGEGDTDFTLGENVFCRFTGMPQNVTASAISFVWYLGETQTEIRKQSIEDPDLAVDFSAYETEEIYQIQPKDCNQECRLAVCLYEEETVKETYESNRIHPIVTFKGTARAGQELAFDMETNYSASTQWFETDGQTEYPLTETFSRAEKYYLKDANVGKRIFAKYKISGESGEYRTALSDEVEASETEEFLRIEEPELSVGMTLNYQNITGVLEGYTKSTIDFYSQRKVEGFRFSIMASEDASLETPEDDQELKCSELSDFTYYISIPQYTLQQEDQGKYIYLKLSCPDLRKPVYISPLSGPVREKKLSIRTTGNKVSQYFYTNEIPEECTSQGAYTCRVLRTTGEEGAEPVEVKRSTHTGSRSESYYFTEADIGFFLFMEFTAADGVKYQTNTTKKILPRDLSFSYASKAEVGTEIKLENSNASVTETVEAKYQYYLTETEEAAEAAQKKEVFAGSVIANRSGFLGNIIPGYRIKDADAGAYLHLDLTIQNYTYTLDLPGKISEREVRISCTNAVEGNAVQVETLGNLLTAPGSRYQWLRKREPDAEGAKDASVGAGTVETAAEGRFEDEGIPSYRLGPEDAGAYLYLKVTGKEGTYYSKSSVGPVQACPLLTGRVSVSGKTIEGETLTARLDGKTGIEGVRMEWYHVGEERPLSNPSENGWEYTLTEKDAGFRIYARAVGDNTLFRGSVSSARTEVVISRLSTEMTGIRAIKAELRNPGKIGWITEQGEDFAKWEDISLDVTVYGVTALPEEFAVGIVINSRTLYFVDHPKGIPGTDSVTFQNLVVSKPELDLGNNEIMVTVAKLVREEGGKIEEYYPVETDPAFLNAETEEPIELNLLNVGSRYGELEVEEGGMASLSVSAEEEGAAFLYQMEEEVSGISVDSNTGTVRVEKGTTEAGRIIVTAVKGHRIGMIGVRILPVSEGAAPENIEISFQDSTNKDRIISELEKLSTGYESDPNKTGEELQNQLWLDAVITPENVVKNYVVEWTSSNPEAAAVDAEGLVTVLKPGAAVTITAAVKGTKLSDSITFTTGTPKYDPKEIYFQAKKITLKEQTYQPLANLKIKYLVNGKTNRTLKAENHLFTFSSSNETVARVNEEGVLLAVAPGEAVITAKLSGSAIQKQIPVVVKDKEYVRVSFVLNGHYVQAERNQKGVLEAEAVLYEGTDVPAKMEYSLDQATAMIVSAEENLLSREAVLTDQTIKLNKKYRTNVPAVYTLRLNNNQKLKLTVTVANTQPKYLRGGVCYQSLGAEAPVSFQIYPGTKIHSVTVPSGGAVSVTSWSQNSETVTVWVKCAENTKPAKKLNTVFEFDTADLVKKEPVKKSVTVPLRVENIPKAEFAPVYLTAEAFSNEGYLLKNRSDDYGRYVDYFEELPEFTDTVENYRTGFYTVCTKIEEKKGGKNPKNLLTVSDGRVMLAKGVRPEEIKPGSYPYEVTYYYQAANSDAKTEEETTVVSVHFTNFEFDRKQLGIHMAYEAQDENSNPVNQEFSMKMYSHKNSNFGILKADLKKSYQDGRYSFPSNVAYELYQKATGKEVEGVLIKSTGSYTDKLGEYNRMKILVESTSELLKEGTKVYPAGTFELRMYAENTKFRPAVILTMPEIAVNQDLVGIKAGKPAAFNQTAFKAQWSEISYSVSKQDFVGSDVNAVMTKAPQMVDPFEIYIEEETGKLVVQADSGGKRTPAAGTYSYVCVMENKEGISSEEFPLNVVVKKAVGDIVVKAKATGKLNPYYHNEKTGEGCVELTFSSNIPALDIWYYSGAVMETPKKTKDTVSYKDVQGRKIGVTENGKKLLFYPKENSYFYSSCDYVPTDIGLGIGYYDAEQGQDIELYSASFKQLKPLAVKEALKDPSFIEYGFDIREKEYEVNLISNNKLLIAEPINPLERLNGKALYRQVDGEFILANPYTVARIESLTLDPKSQKNFEIIDYGPNYAVLGIVNEEIRKEGIQKVTYQMIPSSAASYEKQQVYDTSGNPLYIMTENFDGKETYTPYMIDIPKRVKLTQELMLTYWGSLNPAEK